MHDEGTLSHTICTWQRKKNLDFLWRIKAILLFFFLWNVHCVLEINSFSNATLRFSSIHSAQFLLQLLLIWEILNAHVMINARWHLRCSYQNTDPTCLSQNNIWQVRDPRASSRTLLASARVFANVLCCFESKLTVKSVKSSLLPLQLVAAQVTHLIFMETTFNTPSHGIFLSLC